MCLRLVGRAPSPPGISIDIPWEGTVPASASVEASRFGDGGIAFQFLSDLLGNRGIHSAPPTPELMPLQGSDKAESPLPSFVKP